MRWSPRGRSSNLEDRRGAGPLGIGLGGRGLGLGGLLLLFILSMIFGQDFLTLVGTGEPTYATEGTRVEDPAEEPMVQFVSFVLDDAQAIWASHFREKGMDYPEARLVLFREAVDSACGMAQSATGPFYCPADQKVYIDLGFFHELQQRFGAPGDFAQAYVLAHELGHHVQNLLGINDRVRRAQSSDPDSRNELSVRMELQADCLAGVWGHATAQRDILEGGDVEEGLSAAAAIGDDRLQRMAGRRVSPDSFTHGTSQQRVAWFRRGLESGKMESCETFGSSR